MARTVWILRMRSIDPSEEEAFGSTVYDSEEEAYREAAETAKSLAEDELEVIEWGEGDEAPQLLRSVIRNFQQAKYVEAVEDWMEYSNEYDPDKTFELEEARRG